MPSTVQPGRQYSQLFWRKGLTGAAVSVDGKALSCPPADNTRREEAKLHELVGGFWCSSCGRRLKVQVVVLQCGNRMLFSSNSRMDLIRIAGSTSTRMEGGGTGRRQPPEIIERAELRDLITVVGQALPGEGVVVCGLDVGIVGPEDELAASRWMGISLRGRCTRQSSHRLSLLQRTAAAPGVKWRSIRPHDLIAGAANPVAIVADRVDALRWALKTGMSVTVMGST
jgi:hypothetical protein